MSDAVWSVIKYKPKAGCQDEFKKSLDRLLNHMDRPGVVSSFIELSEGQIVQIIRSPSIDDIIEGQIGGVAWLDSVDHLLEKDEEGSRTEAFSGIEIITLMIFSDGDKVGMAASYDLGQRASLQGWNASTMIPPLGRDWNDELLSEIGGSL